MKTRPQHPGQLLALLLGAVLLASTALSSGAYGASAQVASADGSATGTAEVGSYGVEWANGDNSGNGFGTHDWIITEAKRLADADGAGWLDLNAALLACDDPDMVLHDTYHHVYDVWGDTYGDAPDQIATVYANIQAAYEAGDITGASQQFGLLAHYYGDICNPLHTDQDASEDAIHSAYEDYVETLTDAAGENRAWVVADGLVPISDVRASAVSAATGAHEDYAALLTAWSSEPRDIAAVNAITQTGVNRAANDLADILNTLEDVPPSTGPATIEDQAAAVYFDRFVTGFGGAWSDGTYVYGRWADTALKASFTGSKIRWCGPKQPAYGKADVWVDGVYRATVDCYAPADSATSSTVIWESPDLADGPHTLEIRLTGAKNEASSNYIVVIDKLEVEGGAPGPTATRVSEQGSHAAFIGTWVTGANTTYTDSTYAYSRWSGPVYKAYFSGTKVAWIGPKTNTYGYAKVYIDGAYMATVDCYAPAATTGWRYKIWESAELTPGTHTIEIRPTGTKRAASLNTIVVVDSLEVANYAPVVAPPGPLSRISISISDAAPQRYSTVTVAVTAYDASGRVIPGVNVATAWRFKTTTAYESGVTGEDGVATLSHYISGASAGYRVYVDVTATVGGVTRTGQTSFVPY